MAHDRRKQDRRKSKKLSLRDSITAAERLSNRTGGRLSTGDALARIQRAKKDKDERQAKRK